MIFYSHDTAIDFWRRQAVLGNRANLKACSTEPDLATPECYEDIVGLCPVPTNAETSEDAIHVCVDCKTTHHSKEPVRYHHSSVSLPRGSYTTIGTKCAVASAELAFIQKAASLTFKEAVALGFSLCSSFLAVNEDVDMRGFCGVEAISSASRIAQLALKAKKYHGSKMARRAAKYILDGAASPRELALAMMLTMPRAEGGYGLPRPQLNARIELTQSQRQALQKSFVVADMLWPSKKVVVEYDSDQWHTGTDRISADSKRRNLLKAMGYDVLTVTNSEIKTLSALDIAAECLQRSLKLRKRPVTVKNYELKKRELHSWILAYR